jgi:L-threonylcarbamoyladenylate synthase
VTEVIAVEPRHPDPAAIARAAERLRGGGLVAFPTETVYGLGVHALDRDAVRRLFDAKGRPATDPLIVHVTTLAALQPLVATLPTVAHTLANRFWPGPLTLILPRAPIVPDEVTAGLETVGIRMPAHPVARALIAAAGVPVAAPSANLFSRPSPTRAAHVLEDLDGRIDIVVDGGTTDVGVESTVLDVTTDPPVVLRPGAITLDMLRRAAPQVVMRGDRMPPGGALASPGLLEKHYSPRAPLTLYDGSRGALLLVRDALSAVTAGNRIGVLLPTNEHTTDVVMALPAGESVVIRTLGPSIEDAARQLYAALRELDAAEVAQILALALPARDGLGTAIHDRLRRAAAGRIVRG